MLLINTGSPSALTRRAVASYLREFLSDHRIIDIRAWQRFLLVNVGIVPLRQFRTLRAYQRVWKKASPLMQHMTALREALQKELEPEIVAAYASRYSEPTITQALDDLLQQGITELMILPLFPQYSSAANGSAIEMSLKILARKQFIPAVRVVNCFYDQEFFLKPLTQSVAQALADLPQVDFLLFSYHGLPVRQLPCEYSQDCCAQASNRLCYRRQCLATSATLAKRLQLADDFWATSFQSRLGRIPWIKPYTDEFALQLAARGVKHLAVACPSFVADCLETLEEIGMRLQEDFIKHGGKSLTLIPALNSDPLWVKELSRYIAAANFS